MAEPDDTTEQVTDDIWGELLLDHLHGKRVRYKLVFVPHHEVDYDADEYFRPEFLDHEKQALGYCSGRVLDIGCGAGRHLLWLSEHGIRATGIDTSPGCVQVCRERGLSDVRLASIFDPGPDLEPASFDAAILMGNNIGIGGSAESTRRLLANACRILAPGGWFVVSFVPMDYVPDQAFPDGGVCFSHCVEYDGRRGPLFGWVFYKTALLRALLEESGFVIHRVLRGMDVISYMIARRPLDGRGVCAGPGCADGGDGTWDQALADQLAGNRCELGVEGRGRLALPAFEVERALADVPLPREREALDRVEGRALVIGCGAGAPVAYLQERGLETRGEESSPVAVAAAHARGLSQVRSAAFGVLDYSSGVFDTVVLLRGQLGRTGDVPGTEEFLRALRTLGARDAWLVASFEVTGSTAPATVRLFRDGAPGPWFLWAQFPDEAYVSRLARSAGWCPVDVLEVSETERILVARRVSQVVEG